MTVGQLLKHDFSKGSLSLYNPNGNEIYTERSYGYWYKHDYDTNGNCIYSEWSDGYWFKSDYASNGKVIYFENSDGYWYKQEYDSNGNNIYYENSDGEIIDNRPKKTYNGEVVEIDGKQYKLIEI